MLPAKGLSYHIKNKHSFPLHVRFLSCDLSEKRVQRQRTYYKKLSKTEKLLAQDNEHSPTFKNTV